MSLLTFVMLLLSAVLRWLCWRLLSIYFLWITVYVHGLNLLAVKGLVGEFQTPEDFGGWHLTPASITAMEAHSEPRIYVHISSLLPVCVLAVGASKRHWVLSKNIVNIRIASASSNIQDHKKELYLKNREKHMTVQLHCKPISRNLESAALFVGFAFIRCGDSNIDKYS